jgi:lipopolysaccharide transport system permease protein
MPPRETAVVEDLPDFEIVLRADRTRLSLEWRELWSYRDLFLILIWRDFAAKYKQTVLGPLWFILQPIRLELFRSQLNREFSDLRQQWCTL